MLYVAGMASHRTPSPTTSEESDEDYNPTQELEEREKRKKEAWLRKQRQSARPPMQEEDEGETSLVGNSTYFANPENLYLVEEVLWHYDKIIGSRSQTTSHQEKASIW